MNHINYKGSNYKSFYAHTIFNNRRIFRDDFAEKDIYEIIQSSYGLSRELPFK